MIYLHSPSRILDTLTEDQCNVSRPGGSNQKLKPNKLYQIRSPIDNTLMLAVWTGEKFQDVNEEDLKEMRINQSQTGKTSFIYKIS